MPVSRTCTRVSASSPLHKIKTRMAPKPEATRAPLSTNSRHIVCHASAIDASHVYSAVYFAIGLTSQFPSGTRNQRSCRTKNNTSQKKFWLSATARQRLWNSIFEIKVTQKRKYLGQLYNVYRSREDDPQSNALMTSEEDPTAKYGTAKAGGQLPQHARARL